MKQAGIPLKNAVPVFKPKGPALAHENTECLVHCVSQALQRRGLPRAIYSDNGAAMTSGEFTTGLHRLGIGQY